MSSAWKCGRKTHDCPRIETANVKVPMIVGDQQHVCFDQFSLPVRETSQQALIIANARLINGKPGNVVARKFLVQPNHTVRVSRPMHCVKPLYIGMPLT